MVNVKKENKITKVTIAFPGMYNVEYEDRVGIFAHKDARHLRKIT